MPDETTPTVVIPPAAAADAPPRVPPQTAAAAIAWRPLALKWGGWIVAVALTAALSYFGVRAPVPAPPIEAGGDPVMSFGWVPDPAAIQENRDPAKTLQFGDTPAGKAAGAAADVYLWRYVRQAADLPDSMYLNVNQLTVGCCVGTGTKHAIDCTTAVQAVERRRGERFVPLSAEVIYGGSRVEVGGGRISGDGSLGAWARKFVTAYGVAGMTKAGGQDLTTFSPAKARLFGRSGVPDELEPLVKAHPVKGAALVKNFAELVKANGQGYGVAICSDQGFTMTRDADGFCRPQGVWPHCMAAIGVRGGERPGAFLLNSWGDTAHPGPRFPADAPPAGFWADAAVIDRMLGQGDSFAYSDVVGFPEQKLDWFIRAEPRRDRGEFARLTKGDVRCDPLNSLAW